MVLRERALLEPASAGASFRVGELRERVTCGREEMSSRECEDGCLLTTEHRRSQKSQRTRKVRMRIVRGNDDPGALSLEPGQGCRELRSFP